MQVTHTYSAALDRSDHCLLQYGFVQDDPKPLLAAVDHISGIIVDDKDDSIYGGVPSCTPWPSTLAYGLALNTIKVSLLCVPWRAILGKEWSWPVCVAFNLAEEVLGMPDQARKTGGCQGRRRSRG